MSLNHLALDSSDPKDQGYFADPKMNESVHRILELIPQSGIADVVTSVEHNQVLGARLKEEILKVKMTKKYYNFLDYSEKLTLLSVDEIRKTLDTKILCQDGIQTPL